LDKRLICSESFLIWVMTDYEEMGFPSKTRILGFLLVSEFERE